MEQGKLIKCICHEPIAVSKTARQSWSDVWVQYTGKPGRKKVSWGPTLVSKSDLEHEIQFQIELKNKYPFSFGGEELLELLDIEEKLKTQEVFISNDWDYGTPTIYTASDFIDRKEAEKMLTVMMRGLGFKNVRFKWLRTKVIVRPISF